MVPFQGPVFLGPVFLVDPAPLAARAGETADQRVPRARPPAICRTNRLPLPRQRWPQYPLLRTVRTLSRHPGGEGSAPPSPWRRRTFGTRLESARRPAMPARRFSSPSGSQSSRTAAARGILQMKSCQVQREDQPRTDGPSFPGSLRSPLSAQQRGSWCCLRQSRPRSPEAPLRHGLRRAPITVVMLLRRCLVRGRNENPHRPPKSRELRHFAG